jgi:hypothetical protein
MPLRDQTGDSVKPVVAMLATRILGPTLSPEAKIPKDGILRGRRSSVPFTRAHCTGKSEVGKRPPA